jgi:hypothetical protein
LGITLFESKLNALYKGNEVMVLMLSFMPNEETIPTDTFGSNSYFAHRVESDQNGRSFKGVVLFNFFFRMEPSIGTIIYTRIRTEAG